MDKHLLALMKGNLASLHTFTTLVYIYHILVISGNLGLATFTTQI